MEARVKQVAGLILAAGKSERMGSPKSLLRLFGRSFLEHIADLALGSCLTDTRIVLGHQAQQILHALPQIASRVVINPNYEAGQLSSLQCGLKALSWAGLDAVMIFLVDHPLISQGLVNELILAFRSHPNPLVIPTYHGRRGHPMIFGRTMFDELLNAPLDSGAVAVVRRHLQEILHWEVQEPAILIDIDTPEAYRHFVTIPGKDQSEAPQS